MAKRDYYEVLEINKDVSPEEIKKAYRKQAMKYHPDRNPGDTSAEEKFKEVSEAYEVLSDPDKRVRYDRYGHSGLEDVFSRGGFQWSDFTHAADFEDIFSSFFGENIFGDLFGRSTRRTGNRHQRGSDLRIALKLTLEEIAKGVEKKIKVKRLDKCESCGGTGAKAGSPTVTCPVCQGTGEIRQVSRSFFGQFVNVTECDHCQGEGRIVKDPCPACSGQGRTKDTATISVQIPAGVTSGNFMPLRGQGNAGFRGGPAGDLIVYIEEEEHEQFERHGNDILYELFISFSQAALGDEIEVPTLTGKAKMKVPAGTQSGKIFRLRGKGIPELNGYNMGDQLVRVTVWTPTNITEKQRYIFQELEKYENTAAPKGGRNFFKKVKDTFGV